MRRAIVEQHRRELRPGEPPAGVRPRPQESQRLRPLPVHSRVRGEGRPISDTRVSFRAVAATALCAAALAAGPAGAADGTYSIDGGTVAERAQVHAALRASAFDWSVVPPVIVRISLGAPSSATPGHVILDANLLDAGRLAWGVIQHEFAHELDFLVLDDATRVRLTSLLGGASWWAAPGVGHDQLTSERFASTLAWSYWPAPDNIMRPVGQRDESAAAPPAAFRVLLGALLAHQDPVDLPRISG